MGSFDLHHTFWITAIFSKEDSDTVKSYGIDIILNEFNIIRGDILKAARYGIWSYHHADDQPGRHAGFWEILNNIGNKLFPQRRAGCWALFFGKGSFLESTLFRTNPVSMPKKVFWADPFLCEQDNRL